MDDIAEAWKTSWTVLPDRAAQCALDLALWDWLARREGVTVTELAHGHVPRPVTSFATIGLSTKEELDEKIANELRKRARRNTTSTDPVVLDEGPAIVNSHAHAGVALADHPVRGGELDDTLESTRDRAAAPLRDTGAFDDLLLAGLRELGVDVEVVHPVELLDRAYRANSEMETPPAGTVAP